MPGRLGIEETRGMDTLPGEAHRGKGGVAGEVPAGER